MFSSSATVKLDFFYIDWQGYNKAMQLDEPSVLNINARYSCIRVHCHIKSHLAAEHEFEINALVAMRVI